MTLLFHIIPTFALGGAQVRICQVMNHLGTRYRHAIVALDGQFKARRRLNSDVDLVEIRCDRSTNPLVMARRLRILLNQHRPDMVLTYNWGAIDGVVAALMRPRIPVIHTEDGFGIEEAVRQKKRRILTRRLLLPHATCVVAPSHRLLSIMRDQWHLPEDKTFYIANGIDSRRFIPERRHVGSGEIVIGTAAQLRPEKRIDRLLRVFARIARGRKIRLEVAGDGPEINALRETATALGIAAQVRFLGNVDDISQFYRGLDIFALTSDTEQMPYSVLEAMAAGLPIVSTDVGDVKNMVSSENRRFVVQEGKLVQSLTCLSEDVELRTIIGEQNRIHSRNRYDLNAMLRDYESLYIRCCKYHC